MQREITELSTFLAANYRNQARSLLIRKISIRRPIQLSNNQLYFQRRIFINFIKQTIENVWTGLRNIHSANILPSWLTWRIEKTPQQMIPRTNSPKRILRITYRFACAESRLTETSESYLFPSKLYLCVYIRVSYRTVTKLHVPVLSTFYSLCCKMVTSEIYRRHFTLPNGCKMLRDYPRFNDVQPSKNR